MAPRDAAPGLAGQFLAAWHLLTRLPLPLTPPAEAAAIGRGAWAFPLIGAAIGAIGGGALWLAAWIGLPALAAAALALGAMALATGALHEDGLADTADGLGGGGSREAKLAIMRDSRIGAYGVLALVLATVLRAGALTSLPAISAAAALVAAAALGRAAATVPMALLPPARADGLGHATRGTSPARAVAAQVIAALAAGAALGLALWLREVAPRTVLVAGATALVAAASVGLAVTALARRHIGGFTGDIAGAAAFLGETAALLALAAALPLY
jgi:adenosylcobinamide-GDP ribazoletransferase